MSYNGDIEWGSPSYSGYQRSSMGGFGGSDEYHQELQAFSDAFKQMAFNFNQISEMDKFLTTDRDTQEFRDKLYVQSSWISARRAVGFRSMPRLRCTPYETNTYG